MPAASAISRSPASRPLASRGSPQGSIMTAAEACLGAAAPDRCARPNDGPMLGIGQRDGAKPASQSTSVFVLAERRVIEERVAAVQKPRDAAGFDVPGDVLGGVEDRSRASALPRQRRHGKDAVQSVRLAAYVRVAIRAMLSVRCQCRSPAIRGRREDLDPVSIDERRVFDFGAGDRRVPRERLSYPGRLPATADAPPTRARGIRSRRPGGASVLRREPGVGVATATAARGPAPWRPAGSREHAAEHRRRRGVRVPEIRGRASAATMRDSDTISPSRSAQSATITTCFHAVPSAQDDGIGAAVRRRRPARRWRGRKSRRRVHHEPRDVALDSPGVSERRRRRAQRRRRGRGAR